MNGEVIEGKEGDEISGRLLTMTRCIRKFTLSGTRPERRHNIASDMNGCIGVLEPFETLWTPCFMRLWPDHRSYWVPPGLCINPSPSSYRAERIFKILRLFWLRFVCPCSVSCLRWERDFGIFHVRTYKPSNSSVSRVLTIDLLRRAACWRSICLLLSVCLLRIRLWWLLLKLVVFDWRRDVVAFGLA